MNTFKRANLWFDSCSFLIYSREV